MNRWITTNSIQSELVGQVLEIADLVKVIDGTKDLRLTRIIKDASYSFCEKKKKIIVVLQM